MFELGGLLQFGGRNDFGLVRAASDGAACYPAGPIGQVVVMGQLNLRSSLRSQSYL